MRILHVISTLGSGGAEKMLVDIVDEMEKQSVNCEVAVLTKSQNFFGEELEKRNIKCYYGPSEKVYSLKNILFLKKILVEGSYDCVHTHLFAPQLFTPIASKLANISVPLITTEHSTHNKRRQRKLFYWLDTWVYNQYSKIIAITNDTKNNLITYLPNTKFKTVTIENGIEITKYQNAIPLKRTSIAENLKLDEKIILMVAAMREQKDHETLIRASKILPDDYRVVFVGDGERMDEIKEYAREFGRNTILFLGRRSDVPSIMKSSDVFVLSSKWEGFGLVVVEAAAAGLPVVASDIEGLSEVVKTIGGKLFVPFNEYDLAKNIKEVIELKSDNYNVSQFTIQTTVRKYIKLYKENLKG